MTATARQPFQRLGDTIASRDALNGIFRADGSGYHAATFERRFRSPVGMGVRVRNAAGRVMIEFTTDQQVIDWLNAYTDEGETR